MGHVLEVRVEPIQVPSRYVVDLRSEDLDRVPSPTPCPLSKKTARSKRRSRSCTIRNPGEPLDFLFERFLNEKAGCRLKQALQLELRSDDALELVGDSALRLDQLWQLRKDDQVIAGKEQGRHLFVEVSQRLELLA